MLNGTAKLAPHDERRSWPRIELNAQALLHFERLGPEVRVRIVNASANGLFLAMEQPRPIGTQIDVTVRVADPDIAFSVRGVIVHAVPPTPAPTSGPAGVGIFLTDVGPDWTAFCRQLARL